MIKFKRDKTRIKMVYLFGDEPVTCAVCGTRCDENGQNKGQTECPKCQNNFYFEISEE